MLTQVYTIDNSSLWLQCTRVRLKSDARCVAVCWVSQLLTSRGGQGEAEDAREISQFHNQFNCCAWYSLTLAQLSQSQWTKLRVHVEYALCPNVCYNGAQIYIVFHKKRGSTFVIITRENLDGF